MQRNIRFENNTYIESSFRNFVSSFQNYISQESMDIIFKKFVNSNIEFDSEYLKLFSLIDKPSVYTQLLFSNLKELLNYKSRNKSKNLNNKNLKTTFSEPILSSNSDLALIKITEHCEMLCGESSVYIFEKVKGKWKVKEKILIWIS